MMEAVAAYVRRKQWVVFSLVALCVAVDFARGLAQAFHLYNGSGLAADLGIKIFYLAAIFYSLRSRDFLGYTIVTAAVFIGLFSSAAWLVFNIEAFGIAFSFGDSYHAFENYSRIALVIVSIPTLIALYSVWRPLYRERSEIRKLTDTGLINRYVEIARSFYRFWMQRDRAAQDEANRKMALIYYEVKRRDPTLAPLYALLKEPDDFVRITAARQLLSRKNDTALSVLDAIARQHSEFSGFAQRMAAQWRKGELKAWG
jgi:hypothetical protein